MEKVMDISEFRIKEENSLFIIQRLFKDYLRVKHLLPPFPKREMKYFDINRDGNRQDYDYYINNMSFANIEDAKRRIKTLLEPTKYHNVK